MTRPVRALVDANVFVAVWTLDVLLTLADRGAFEPVWSEAVLDEAREAVNRVHGTNGGARYTAAAVRAFPNATLAYLAVAKRGIDCHFEPQVSTQIGSAAVIDALSEHPNRANVVAPTRDIGGVYSLGGKSDSRHPDFCRSWESKRFA